MLRLSLALCGFVLVCAAFCPDAVAAEEEAPQTGTIEGRVVDMEDGAPVERALVQLVDMSGYTPTVRQQAATSAEGTYRFGQVTFGDYEVRLRHPDERRGELDIFRSSKFVYDEAACTRSVTLSAAVPTARADFQVERGWRLSGTITETDGTPIQHVIIRAQQSPEFIDVPRALTDDEGRYELSGLKPNEVTFVSVNSTSWSADLQGPWYRGATLWEGRLEPRKESATLDVRVSIATVEVEVEFVRALWPFGERGPTIGTIEVRRNSGGHSESFPLAALPRTGRVHRTVFEELPTDVPVTIGLGILTSRKEVTPSGAVCFPEELILKEQELHCREGRQEVRLEYIEPHARLSRALWFGVLPAIVLLILVPILVRQARRRRARERKRSG